MKKILLTTALALTLFATATNTIYAATQSAQTNAHDKINAATTSEINGADVFYPEDEFTKTLTFTSLDDYAVHGDDIYFIDGGTLLCLTPDYSSGYRGDMKLCAPSLNLSGEQDESSANDGLVYVTAAEWYGDNLYVMVENTSYILSDGGNLTAASFDFSRDKMQKAGEYYYFFSDGDLCAYNTSIVNLGDGYSQLKCYGDSAYAVKDNILYTINGEEVYAISTIYKDFTPAESIATGDIKDKLKSGFDSKFVVIPVGRYCTEIILDELDGPFLSVGDTMKIDNDLTCLVLCEVGNANIVIANIDDKDVCLIAKKQDENAYYKYNLSTTDVIKAYTNDSVALYSCPYISKQTRISTIPDGATVEVEGIFDDDNVNINFYKVTYTTELGQSVTGFAATSRLTPSAFAAEKNSPQKISDEKSYENDVQRVVLIMIIVGLVILAIAYLTIVTTRPKSPRRRNDTSDE